MEGKGDLTVEQGKKNEVCNGERNLERNKSCWKSIDGGKGSHGGGGNEGRNEEVGTKLKTVQR